MIEHRTERIVGIRARGGFFDGFRNRQAERALIVRIGRQRGAPRFGHVRRAGEDFRSPGLHHRATIGFLAVADLDHIDAHVETEHLPGQRHRTAPLAGAGFGGDALDAGLLVVIRLGHGGVGFVRTCRGNALVLVVDARRCAQRFLEPRCAHQRRRSPQPIDFAHGLRNRNPALGRHLLLENRHRENRAHLFRRRRLAVRTERRRGRIGHVGDDVVPVRRNFGLGQNETQRFHGHSRRRSKFSKAQV